MKWPQKSLDELGEVKRGKSKHRPRDAAHLYGGPYPFIQTGDVKHSGLYVTSNTQTYSEAGLAQSKLWPKGTLCITIAANIADTSILSFDACFPDSLIGFKADPDKSDVRFVKYLMDTLKKRFRQFSQGAAQDNLSLEKLISLKFQVPELTLQIKIADMLSNYDQLIEINEKKISLLEESARILHKEWFVRLKFPGHEKTKIKDGVPFGWNKGVILDLGEVVTGKTPPTINSDYYGEYLPFIKTPDMHGAPVVVECEQYLSELGANSQQSKHLPQDATLVACIGAGIGAVSMTGMQCQTNQQINAIIPKENFFKFFNYFEMLRMKPRLQAIGGGATMPNVNKGKFESITVVIPDNGILESFNNEVELSFLLIKNLLKQNIKLKVARDLLLPRLISGEIEL